MPRIMTQSPTGDPIGPNIVQSRADLPAPVGGLITLPSGCWDFSKPFSLAETIVIPAGFAGALRGCSPGARLTHTGPLAFDVQLGAEVQMLALAVEAASGDCFHVANDTIDEVLFSACDFRAAGDCVRVDSGAVRLVSFRSDSFNRAIVSRGGAEVQVIGARLIAGNLCVVMDGGNVLIQGGNLHSMNQGFAVVSPGNTAQLLGVTIQNCGTCVDGTVAGLTAAMLVNCRMRNAGNGIVWPAASVPTDGLSISACAIDNVGAAFNGFTHLSPRVNSKGNLFAGALASETPIVP